MGAAGAATGFARTFPMRDEPSRLEDTTSESEDEQIRFATPEGRIQARVEDPKRRANL